MSSTFSFEKFEYQLTPGIRYTIYVIWKFFLYRRYIGKPAEEFSYLQLQSYYERFKFKIIPKILFRKGRPLHWHTLERAIRYLRSQVDPPLLVNSGEGFFRPTQEFWSYIRYRVNKYGVFWPELRNQRGG